MRSSVPVIFVVIFAFSLVACSKNVPQQTLKADSSGTTGVPVSGIISPLEGSASVAVQDTTAPSAELAGVFYTRSDIHTRPRVMSGSDPFLSCYSHDRDRLLLYPHFAVAIFEKTEYAGDSICVFAFSDQTDSSHTRYLVGGKPVFSEGDMGLWFNGMLDNYLLLDLGTGPDRAFSVYCLTDTARHVYSDDCARISVARPDSVTYYEILRDRHPTERDSPEVAEAKAGGLTPVFMERVVLSLQTKVKRRTGDIVVEILQ